MKYIFTILIYFTCTIGYSQDTKALDGFIEENCTIGAKGFYKTIYKNIKYPLSARETCTVGKLKTRLLIDKEGSIQKVQFLNLLGEGLENEVIRTMSFLSKEWKPVDLDTIRIVDFTIAWQIGEDPNIEGDLNVIAIGGSCTSNEEYLSKLRKLIKKEQYKKAKYIAEELVKRDPDSKRYQQLDTFIAKQLKL